MLVVLAHQLLVELPWGEQRERPSLVGHELELLFAQLDHLLFSWASPG